MASARSRPLHGKYVLLSASIPQPERDPKFRRRENASEYIEEAILGVTRAVLAAGANLVYGGHPTITPIVSMIAAEYYEPLDAERRSRSEMPLPAGPRVLVYQSRVFENELPFRRPKREQRRGSHNSEREPVDWALYNQGYASVTWTDVQNNEVLEPGSIGRSTPCPASIDYMRRRMIGDHNLSAMFCIGGMEGVLEEAKLFREMYPGRPIYAFESTGGATELLQQEAPDLEVQFIDTQLQPALEEGLRSWKLRTSEQSSERDRQLEENYRDLPPYSLLAQLALQDVK